MVFGSIFTRKGGKIKLIGTKLDGSLSNSFASVSFEQEFKNETDLSQDCTLIINGGMDFIVYNVRIVIGEKTMEFVLREIEEAKTSHQQSLNSGYTSGIVTNESSDALKFEIGNIAAKESFKVLIDCSFTATLDEKDELSFRLPFEKEFAGSQLTCELQLQMQSKIQSVTATAGKATFAASEDGNSGKLSVTGKIDNQLSLIVKLEEDIADSAICTTIDGETFVGVAITPIFDEESAAKATKAEVILVIDCSGSMSGTPINVATETLTIFLRSLRPGSLFNVVRFGSTFEAMYPTSVEYTRENFEDALQKVSIMRADLGGTDLLSPLTDIFSWPAREGFVRQIFVLTDGEVENQSECLSLATKNRAFSRLFALGIGSSVSRGFIEELAKTSSGEPSFVATSTEVPKIVLSQLSAALRGAVTDVQLHVEGTEAIEVAPFPIPPLFTGSLTHLFVKLPSVNEAPAVLIAGRAGDNDFESAVVCDEASKIRLDKLFAFFNIRDLEESLTLIKDKQRREEIRRNAVAQSSRYGIVSQFTALWSVVEGEAIEPSQAQPKAQNHTEAQQPRMKMQAMNRRQTRGRVSYSMADTGYTARTTSQNSWGYSQKRYGMDSMESEMLYCAAPSPTRSRSKNKSNKPGFFKRVKDFLSKHTDETECCEETMFSMQEQSSCEEKEEEGETIQETVKNVPTSYSITGLLSLQDFDGFWPADTLKAISNFAKGVPEMDGAEFTDDKVRATVLALAILRLRESEQVDVWQLVAQKAMEWLKGISAETDWNAVIESVLKSLSI